MNYNRKTNAFTIVKKTSTYYALLITQKCWKITYGKVIVNRLYHKGVDKYVLGGAKAPPNFGKTYFMCVLATSSSGCKHLGW